MTRPGLTRLANFQRDPGIARSERSFTNIRAIRIAWSLLASHPPPYALPVVEGFVTLAGTFARYAASHLMLTFIRKANFPYAPSSVMCRRGGGLLWDDSCWCNASVRWFTAIDGGAMDVACRSPAGLIHDMLTVRAAAANGSGTADPHPARSTAHGFARQRRKS